MDDRDKIFAIKRNFPLWKFWKMWDFWQDKKTLEKELQKRVAGVLSLFNENNKIFIELELRKN